MADLIALGVVTAVGACSGPLIPFKAGRVDSVVAGDLGVPEEFGALSKHIEQFSRAGMNQKAPTTGRSDPQTRHRFSLISWKISV